MGAVSSGAGKAVMISYSPITDRSFPVDAKIKSRHTANEIMKQSGIEHRF